MSKRGKIFESEAEFCPQCGSILPLPGMSDAVKCMQCKFKIDISEYEGQETKGTIVFNRIENMQTHLQNQISEDIEGPTVQRKCSKCGNDNMTYTTRQTRSADEGQTVFYTCTRCRFQETDYS